VRNRKDEGANHMTTMGSLTLCRTLLKAGLVDRFRVVVFPVITGSTGSAPRSPGHKGDGRIQLTVRPSRWQG